MSIDPTISFAQQVSKPKLVVAVTAGKGGVGKTNISVNLAVAMADLQQKVMLLDADLGLANVDVLLGLHSKLNLSNVMLGQCELQDIVITGPGQVKVLPGASGIYQMSQLNKTQHVGLIHAFSELANQLDVLVIDTAAGISDSVTSFVSASQEVVVVVCDEPASLADAYALIKVLSKHHNTHRFQVLANMVRNKIEGREIYHKLKRVAEKYLDVQLGFLGAIPYDNMLKRCVKEQQSVCAEYPSAKSSKSLQDIAKQLLDLPVAHDGAGKIQFFIEHLMEYRP